MVRMSNNLISSLNVLTFLMSIPILWAGIWLKYRAASECDRFLENPVIALGIVGACCGVSWLLWVYLFVTFLFSCFTIFAFVVTNKGAGQVLSGKGYKEYHLGDYSNWLQTSTENWSKIRSCLVVSNVCPDFSTTAEELYAEHLSPVESGCCMPSGDECNFIYIGSTKWTKIGSDYTNPDCNVWDNKASTLCFDCQSCKAGVLNNIKRDSIVFIVVLIIVYLIGCCAFRNNRHHNSWKRQYT